MVGGATNFDKHGSANAKQITIKTKKAKMPSLLKLYVIGFSLYNTHLQSA